MKILSYEIPESLKNDKFIQSIFTQFQNNKSISKRQEEVLKDILNISEELPTIEFKEYKIYLRRFNRTDYHGDYLLDSRTYLLTDDCDYNPTSKIRNENALDHGVVEYVDEFKIYGSCLIPTSAKSPKLVFNYLYEFNKIYEKIQRNRFKTIKNKNIAIRALRNILTSTDEVDLKLLETALQKRYW